MLDELLYVARAYDVDFVEQFNKVYISCSLFDVVKVFDCDRDTISATISGFGFPTGLCAQPTGNAVWVCDRDNNRIVLIDAQVDTVFSTIPLSFPPEDIDIQANGAFAHVCGDGTLISIDTSNLELIGSASFSGTAEQIEVTLDGTRVYIITRNTLWSIDIPSFAAESLYSAAPGYLSGIDIDQSTGLLFLGADTVDGGFILVYDVSNNTNISVVPAAHAFMRGDIEVIPGSDYVYVGETDYYGHGRFDVILKTNFNHVGVIELPQDVGRVSSTINGDTLFVTAYASNYLMILTR